MSSETADPVCKSFGCSNLEKIITCTKTSLIILVLEFKTVKRRHGQLNGPLITFGA